MAATFSTTATGPGEGEEFRAIAKTGPHGATLHPFTPLSPSRSTLALPRSFGARAALAVMAAGAGDNVAVQAGPGQLTYYLEKRRGALRGLIAAHGIVVLDKPAWDARKAELGPAVLD